MIKIDKELAENIVSSFVKPRQSIPHDVECVIVEKHKKYYMSQLVGKEIKQEAIEKLRTVLEKAYLNSLIQPGETVGIICGQCIGERTTQSSLNNFHSAGLDTGSTSQIDNLQTIINASKIKKRKVRKYFRVSLYMINRNLNLKQLKNLTAQYLDEVKFSDIIVDIQHKNVDPCIHPIFKGFSFESKKNVVKFVLDLEKIYSYRITRDQLIKAIPSVKSYCLPYSLLEKEDTTLDFYCEFVEDNVFEFLKKARESLITGIEGVKSHVFMQTNSGEWYIDCLCNKIMIFFEYSHIFDINRIICNSVNDMFIHFGVLVAYQLIIEKCKEIIPGIDTAHFKLLAMRMTKNGNLEPLTRYTMRNNSSPLTKASFEESFETFIKACKFNEKEKFKSISSAIICGKKPRVGTYQCDILIDPKFYF